MGIHFQSLSNQVTNQTYQSNMVKAKIFIIIGASGTLAKVKIVPALWDLFRAHALPKEFHCIAYARSKLTIRDIKNRCANFMTEIETDRGRSLKEDFWKHFSYVRGEYKNIDKAENLTKAIEDTERSVGENVDRIFYIALPASVQAGMISLIKTYWMAKKGTTRIVCEKPYGNDLTTSNELQNQLDNFTEDQICRIDHQLSHEMVKGIMHLRFANRMFSGVWNKDSVSAVLIACKDKSGVRGQAGRSFDEQGIIRDMQNHMFNVMAIVGMEQPDSLGIEHMREAKNNFMRSIRKIDTKDVIIAQYKGKPGAKPSSEEHFSYKDDPSIPPGSKTPTFATIVCHVDNERWEGVPFILMFGKATREDKDEARIQFKEANSRQCKKLFPNVDIVKNEIVFQFKPVEKLCLRTTLKHPGFECEIENHEVDLSYDARFNKPSAVGTYPRVIHSLFADSGQAHFLTKDDVEIAWSLLTPILNEVEEKRLELLSYEHGSRGPAEAPKLCARNGFNFSDTYNW